MPVGAISSAVTRPTRSRSSGLQLAAMASCVGKMLAPFQNEWPWMPSSPMSSGIPRRFFAARSIARPIFAPRMCSSAPGCRVLTKERSSPRASSISSWPTFSSSVMRETRSATRSSTERAGFRYGGAPVADCAVTGGEDVTSAADARATPTGARRRTADLRGISTSRSAGTAPGYFATALRTFSSASFP